MGSITGSPPQVRGKPYVCACCGRGNRITPAGAGKTTKNGGITYANKDHPRRCGENPCICLSIGFLSGSPPQVRGKRGKLGRYDGFSRITPAGAGKTRWLLLKGNSGQDHPRRCGENSPIRSFSARRTGSPPQVRGKRSYNFVAWSIQRITPAGAGKTTSFVFVRAPPEDHPRRCGENYQLFFPGAGLRGSPPQVRGKRCTYDTNLNRYRITPAGAGKTIQLCCIGIQLWDHPRRCGENANKDKRCSYALGSPPQVRGKLGMAAFANFWQKDHPRRCGENKKIVTPSGMETGSPPQVRGKPASLLHRYSPPQDHPRRCGENNKMFTFSAQEIGSPPQVRGKHVSSRSISYDVRITPAGAGKTDDYAAIISDFWDHPRRCGENTKKIL